MTEEKRKNILKHLHELSSDLKTESPGCAIDALSILMDSSGSGYTRDAALKVLALDCHLCFSDLIQTQEEFEYVYGQKDCL